MPADAYTFHRWLDVRNVPFPDGDDRTGDTVAEVGRTDDGGRPWAVAVEFQVKPSRTRGCSAGY